MADQALLDAANAEIRSLRKEITQLKASLEESRNDAKVFQEWYKREDANVKALTEQLGVAQEKLDVATRANWQEKNS